MAQMDKIVELVKHDKLRIISLDCVFQLNLPQCYLAAGFVRNLVWDHLHQKQVPTPLNDLDVIYFDPTERSAGVYLEYEALLKEWMPKLNWQVRNQAQMHIRNGDRPYRSSIDAMSFWPEKETAVGIRKAGKTEYECVSAFGFESLFNLEITHNPKRNRDIFERRLKSKDWLAQWPNLTVAP
jgi:uncharacterized protein